MEKARAISEVIIGARKSIFEATRTASEATAKGNLVAAGLAASQIPIIKASAAASIAAITAQGLKQGKQLGGGGAAGGGGGASGYTPPERRRGFFETDYRSSFQDPSIDRFSPSRPDSMGTTIVLQGSLDEEVMAYKVKSGNAKIESGTTYLGD